MPLCHVLYKERPDTESSAMPRCTTKSHIVSKLPSCCLEACTGKNPHLNLKNWKLEPALAVSLPDKKLQEWTFVRKSAKNVVVGWKAIFDHSQWRRFFLSVYPPSVVFIAPSKNKFPSHPLLCKLYPPQKACWFWNCPYLCLTTHAQYITWVLTSARLDNYNRTWQSIESYLIAEQVSRSILSKCYLKNSPDPLKQQLKGYELWITSDGQKAGGKLSLRKISEILNFFRFWVEPQKARLRKVLNSLFPEHVGI